MNCTPNVALKSVSKGALSILGSVPLPRYPSTSTGWGQDLHSVNAQMRVTERGREEDKWPGEHNTQRLSWGENDWAPRHPQDSHVRRKTKRLTCLGSRRKFAAWYKPAFMNSWHRSVFRLKICADQNDMSTEIIMIFFGKTHWILNACF